jgi:hypothetical protein
MKVDKIKRKYKTTNKTTDSTKQKDYLARQREVSN